MPWELRSLEDYDRQFKWYEKKRRNELTATLDNLSKFFAALGNGARVESLLAAHRYLHAEPMGVVAVDQKGGARNLAEMRLYTLPDQAASILYLIPIGDKDSQADDIQFCRQFVSDLKKG